MTTPTAGITRRQVALLCLGAGCLHVSACMDAAEPNPVPAAENKASARGPKATTSTLGGNAVYQIRKESGASAYDSTNNTTYITYNGPDMDIYVRAYDNTTSTWRPLTLAKTWTHYA